MVDFGDEKNEPSPAGNKIQCDKTQASPTMAEPETDQKKVATPPPRLYRPRTQKEIMPRSEDISGSSLYDDKVAKLPAEDKTTKPIVKVKVSSKKQQVKQQSTKSNQTAVKTKPPTDDKILLTKQEDPAASPHERKQKKCPTNEVEVHVVELNNKGSPKPNTKEPVAENNEAICDKNRDVSAHEVHIVDGQFLLGFDYLHPYKFLTKEQWEKCKDTDECDYVVLLRKHSETVRPDQAVIHSSQVTQAMEGLEQAKPQSRNRKKPSTRHRRTKEAKDDQNKDAQDGGSPPPSQPKTTTAHRHKKSDEEKNAAVRRSGSHRRRLPKRYSQENLADDKNFH